MLSRPAPTGRPVIRGNSSPRRARVLPIEYAPTGRPVLRGNSSPRMVRALPIEYAPTGRPVVLGNSSPRMARAPPIKCARFAPLGNIPPLSIQASAHRAPKERVFWTMQRRRLRTILLKSAYPASQIHSTTSLPLRHASHAPWEGSRVFRSCVDPTNTTAYTIAGFDQKSHHCVQTEARP